MLFSFVVLVRSMRMGRGSGCLVGVLRTSCSVKISGRCSLGMAGGGCSVGMAGDGCRIELPGRSSMGCGWMAGYAGRMSGNASSRGVNTGTGGMAGYADM